jgi:hypothetical protein
MTARLQSLLAFMLCNPPPRSVECRLREAPCLLSTADWRQAATRPPAHASTYFIERCRDPCTIRVGPSEANRSRDDGMLAGLKHSNPQLWMCPWSQMLRRFEYPPRHPVN